jgi:hypothetical protein
MDPRAVTSEAVDDHHALQAFGQLVVPGRLRVFLGVEDAVMLILADDRLSAGQQLELGLLDLALRRPVLARSPGLDRLHDLVFGEAFEAGSDSSHAFDNPQDFDAGHGLEVAIPQLADGGMDLPAPVGRGRRR